VREEFLGYYNRELTYLRQLAAEFGRNHPTVASSLMLTPNRCDDPHVERLLEGFAFLAARIHLRIDDEFPEITGALLEELYPYFMRPAPSVSLVEFQLDKERGKSTATRRIARGTPIQSRPSEGFVCRFRTCYDTALHPIAVEQAVWRPGSSLTAATQTTRPTAAVLEIRLSCLPDVMFSGLDLSGLRFYLDGGNDLVHALYELLLTKVHTIKVLDGATGKPSTVGDLNQSALTPAGFEENEGLSWYPRRSFAGYQLLEDYFAFPEKFLFVDLNRLENLRQSGIERQAVILFLISPFDRADWRSILEQGVSASTFRLNCTPIVNLFPVTSDPIPVRSGVYEAPIPVDSRAEIYSVDEIYGQVSFSAERKRFDRYIDCQAGSGRVEPAGYWHAVRRPSRREEDVSEMFLTLLNREGLPVAPDADSVTVKCTCTNRDRPSQLPIGERAGSGGDRKSDFQMEEHPEVQKILCLRRPTHSYPAPAARTSLWRLVSQLALNHLSLMDEGRGALQTLLRLHNLGAADFAEESIKGILKIESKPDFARVYSEHGIAFVRGKRVEMSVDEDRFTGSGAFLFGSVLERFLGLYTSLNSFSQLSMRSRQRGDKLVHAWPARAGSKVVA
jgi:type VI secretion system protein ImpG